MVRSWIEKATNDHRTAKVAMELSRPIADTSAFHCQQAIEKLLKAFLTLKEFEFENIHDLELLAQQCAKLDSDFRPLIERVAPVTAYAVRFRYPGPGDPTVEEVQEALSVVDQVWNFVIAKLPPETRP